MNTHHAHHTQACITTWRSSSSTEPTGTSCHRDWSKRLFLGWKSNQGSMLLQIPQKCEPFVRKRRLNVSLLQDEPDMIETMSSEAKAK
jgi:hypothetical protein